MYIHESTFEFDSGRSVAHKIFTSSECPTAIAAVNDMVALGVIDAADELGIKVPDEISVTGADDIFPHYKPRLTTFNTPMEDLGRKAVGLLIEIINDAGCWHKVRNANKHVISGQMIFGKTTSHVKNE